MATLEQLSTALKNAHAAGDADAAQKLANAIQQMQGAAPAAAPEPAAPVEAAPPLDAGLTAENIGGSSLSRKAYRNPIWPEPTVGPIDISKTPMFRLPRLPSGLPPEEVSQAGELGIPSELGLGASLNTQAAPWLEPEATFPAPQAPPGGWAPQGPADPNRMFKLDAQAAGSGLLGTAMMPLDIPILASKALGAGTEYVGDKVAGMFGQPTTQEFFDQRNAEPLSIPLASNVIKDAVSSGAAKLGYEQPEPSSPAEKLRSNLIEFGTGGLSGSAILRALSKLRAARLAEPGALPMMGDKYLKPYFETPNKAMVGDTLAGAGAGGAVTATQEIPESIRQQGGGAVGAVADLAAMAGGAVSGGTLGNIMTKTPSSAYQLWARSRPDYNLAVDPVTGAPTTRGTADEAAKFLQANSLNPRLSAQELTDNAAMFRDLGPVPTSGLLTSDQGLQGIEKRTRIKSQTGPALPDANASLETRQSHSFGARDQALRDAASERVAGVRPPGADAELFPQTAQVIGDTRINAADQAVEQARTQAQTVRTQREAPANELLAERGRTPGASADIYDQYQATRELEHERSRMLYQNPQWQNSVVDANPLLDAADNVTGRARPASPVDPVAQQFLARIDTARETGSISGRELTDLKADIEHEIATRGLKNGSLFRQLKDLKDGINDTVQALPADHPGRQAYDAAETNFQTRVAPSFREGAGGALDRRLKSDRGQVYPEEAGAKFLNRGQDAEQLMRIGQLRGTQDEIRDASRTILRDQMTQQGVINNGVIDPDRLQAWWDKRTHITQHIPGLDAEIHNMLTEAQRGAASTAAAEAGTRTAERGLRTTTQEVQQGPLGMVSNKTPEKAVEAVMGSGNPPENMARLAAEYGTDANSKQSLKAAVSDWFTRKVSSLDPANEHDFNVRANALQKTFDQHRKTLVEAGFTPEDMNRLQQAQTLILPLLKRNVQATVGSTTAESTEAALRPLELALKAHYGILKGGGVMRTVKVGLRTLKGDPTNEIERLITRAMFEPELAAALLTRDIAKVGTPAWNSHLQRLIRRTAVARDLAQPAEKDDSEE